ncbi:hypothetical protein ACFSR2_24620 [Emticicia soli]|uniref:Uncharacterized protein n=1 Tax=Emticicia soli TaxID=2027878 RepID=A0ABW5JFF7_9BACT
MSEIRLIHDELVSYLFFYITTTFSSLLQQDLCRRITTVAGLLQGIVYSTTQEQQNLM